VIPRRADVVGLAAACAAVVIAAQLSIEHWFYLYIPWFFALAMVALLGRFGAPVRSASRRTATAGSAPGSQEGAPAATPVG
jgi:hypothetical protein